MDSKTGVQPLRRHERAQATRQRIVEAAYRLISARGYMQTTMADVAAESGVAVQTVYFTFHNKPALMRAAYQYAVHGDHTATSPDRRPWFDALLAEPDHERALALFVDASIEILRRVVPLAAIFKAMDDDQEVASFYALGERLRRDGFRRVVDALAQKKPLRAGLDPDEATTILLVLVGTDVYRSMLGEHGWPESRWRSWVIRTVSESLFGP